MGPQLTPSSPDLADISGCKNSTQGRGSHRQLISKNYLASTCGADLSVCWECLSVLFCKSEEKNWAPSSVTDSSLPETSL